MRKRLTAVMVAMAVVLSGIGMRLYGLSQSNLQAASVQQSTRRAVMAVSRGTIYDRYGRPLVNRSRDIVASVAPFEECVAQVDSQLSAEIRHAAREAWASGERVTVHLTRWVSPTVGITQVSAPCRYGHEASACHVIGYVDGENCGVSGVEHACEAVLSAFAGEAAVSYPIDALGRVSIGGEDVLLNTLDRAVGGVALTLDAEIQRIAEEAAWSLSRGAVVVSDAESGEILASVSVPIFDQNDVASALNDDASPLLDRARLNYNLGSVFKIMVAAAALENGVDVNREYVCNGSITVDGIRFHCHNALGDGKQTMREAMAKSCNCYFIQLALEIGASAVYDLAVRAGLADAWSLMEGYDTACAVLPSRRDLSADAALANLAIGQGDLLVTPVHVAALLQAVAADGVMTAPSLWFGTVDEQGALTATPSSRQTTRLFSRSTAVLLRDLLKAVVRAGTGTSAAPADGKAAGKTGTAETGWVQNGEEVVQSWFAGVYPAEHPQYVIVVLSENGGTNGKTAAPVFAAVADGLSAAGLVENDAEDG